MCRNEECRKPRPEELALNNLRHEGPQLLVDWIKANPSLQQGPQQLDKWLLRNIALATKKPLLAEWIEDHPAEAQLKLLGKNTREATASERKATQLAIAVPSRAPLSRKIPEEVKRLPLLGC